MKVGLEEYRHEAGECRTRKIAEHWEDGRSCGDPRCEPCDRFCKCHEWLDVSGWFKGYDDNDARERAIAWAEAEPAIRFYEMGAAYPVGKPGSREHDIATYYTVNVWAGFDK